ncbi:hypothetical protein [Pseudonocardia alni]|uniref:hypothetical protein n=1 Tax=Bacteria TaxID=2 RepID=UPI00332EC47F
MDTISVRIPRVYFTDGRVSTDALQQKLHQALWERTGVMPAPVRVFLHEGQAIMASGCGADDVENILGLGVKHG